MILIVSKGKADAEHFAESLNIMGYLAVGVKGAEAKDTLAPAYRAVIVLNPDNIAALDLLLYYNTHGLDIPVFAIGDTEDERFSEVYRHDISASNLIKKITRYLTINEKPVIGKYMCAGFNASALLSTPFFFDTPLALTKTEKMILAYLTKSYPLPASSENIIRHALPPSRTPEPSTIRAHISSINKKFREITGRAMIEFYESGYLIITPELKYKKFK